MRLDVPLRRRLQVRTVPTKTQMSLAGDARDGILRRRVLVEMPNMVLCGTEI